MEFQNRRRWSNILYWPRQEQFVRWGDLKDKINIENDEKLAEYSINYYLSGGNKTKRYCFISVYFDWSVVSSLALRRNYFRYFMRNVSWNVLRIRGGIYSVRITCSCKYVFVIRVWTLQMAAICGVQTLQNINYQYSWSFNIKAQIKTYWRAIFLCLNIFNNLPAGAEPIDDSIDGWYLNYLYSYPVI